MIRVFGIHPTAGGRYPRPRKISIDMETSLGDPKDF
jgi:hypothetical protein